MMEVKPSFGKGAFAAIEILRVQTPGDADATSVELRTLHDPLVTVSVRAPRDGLWSSALSGVLDFATTEEVVIHAPDSGRVAAEKYVLEIELSRPLVTVRE